MTQRLQQPALKIYTTIDSSLVAAANGQLSADEITDNLTTICQHFKDDLDYRKLRQSFEDLPVIMDNEPASCVQDIVDKVVELGPAKRLHAQLVRLLTLYRVMPVTSATAERSFSTLRRVKAYLWSTMTQKRLNSVLVLHAHQDYTDSIMRHVARDFVAFSDNRKSFFGTFWNSLLDIFYTFCDRLPERIDWPESRELFLF